MGLAEYRKKRDFTRTSEPAGGAGAGSGPVFVVQKHDASRLHYDFRIEAQGVLKSWAVPKGPSIDPAQKRLAVMTEDHPMGYASFEGTIPEGNYGAGTVIVWDTGRYESLKEKSVEEQIEEGHVTVRLLGRKLKGGYSLIKTKRGWLLVKMSDEHAAKEDILEKEPRSVLSDKTIEEMRGK